MAEELERKYLNVSADTLRPRLAALGASLVAPAHFETNIIYDRADCELTARRRLLRLRTREWSKRTDARLTYKEPLPDVMVAGRPAKRREEYELGIDDPGTLHTILLKLGFKELFRYEKVRESWSLCGAHVDMDRLPFMDCVEIEGAAPLLGRLESLLGLDTCPMSTNSYHVLHLEWLAAQHLPGQDGFVFDEATRTALRASLSLADLPPNL